MWNTWQAWQEVTLVHMLYEAINKVKNFLWAYVLGEQLHWTEWAVILESGGLVTMCVCAFKLHFRAVWQFHRDEAAKLLYVWCTRPTIPAINQTSVDAEPLCLHTGWLWHNLQLRNREEMMAGCRYLNPSALFQPIPPPHCAEHSGVTHMGFGGVWWRMVRQHIKSVYFLLYLFLGKWNIVASPSRLRWCQHCREQKNNASGCAGII